MSRSMYNSQEDTLVECVIHSPLIIVCLCLGSLHKTYPASLPASVGSMSETIGEWVWSCEK